MRTWMRAVTATRCGGPCGGVIPTGAPMLRLSLPGIERMKFRCRQCADEPVPAVIPIEQVEGRKTVTSGQASGCQPTAGLPDAHPDSPTRMTQLGPGVLPFKWNPQREREPGDDDE